MDQAIPVLDATAVADFFRELKTATVNCARRYSLVLSHVQSNKKGKIWLVAVVIPSHSLRKNAEKLNPKALTVVKYKVDL